MKEGQTSISQDSKVLIDTNVLVYAVELKSNQNAAALSVIEKHCTAGTCVVSSQNLAEFMNVVDEKNKLGFEEARVFIRKLADSSIILTYTGDDVLRASQIRESYSIPFFDALLVATMERENIHTVVTENVRDFKKVPWLNVLSPFLKK